MPSIKELYSRLNDVKIDADSINLNTDGLESLLATTQADIALIKTDLANGVLSDVRDGTGNALTSSARGSQRALSVQIVDASGNQITSFGSATVNSNTLDGSGNAITSTTQGSTRRLDVMLSSGGATGSTAPTNANLMGGTDGTNLRGFSVDSSGRPNVNVNGTVPVSGTVTANNQALTTGTGTASGSSTSGTDLLASTDVSGFAEASVQFTSFATGAPAIQPQVSNDNSTWVNTTVQNVQGITTTSANSIAATGIFKVALLGSRYFRLRVATNGTGGTYDFTYTLNPRTTFPNTQSVVFAATPSVTSTPVGGSSAGASVGVYSNYLTISSAGTNATNIRTVQCVLYMCNITNLTSSFKYLKLFNTGSTITVGTSTPTFTIPIPPNSTIPFDCGGVGIRFTNGLAFSITGGLATSDTTAVLAGDVVVNIAYV
jgi:hypothetical protein